MKILEHLKKPLGRTSAVDIEACLREARAALAKAEADRAAADKEYRAALLNPDNEPAIDALGKRTKAELAKEKAQAAIEAFTARLHEASERDDEERRQAVYAAAKKAADEAAERLRIEYPNLAGKIVALLRQTAEAEALVRDANRSLPRGAAPLAPPESAARGLPYVPKKILTEKTVDRWVYAETGMIVPEDEQNLPKRFGGVGDYAIGYDAGSHSTSSAHRVVKKRFRHVRMVEEQFARDLPPLARTLRLPAAATGQCALWEPLDQGYGDVEVGEVDHQMAASAASKNESAAPPVVVEALEPLNDAGDVVASHGYTPPGRVIAAEAAPHERKVVPMAGGDAPKLAARS